MKRLTNIEKKLILDLASNTISKKEFLSKYPSKEVNNDDYLTNLLKDTLITKSGEDLEYIFYLPAGTRAFNADDVPTLSELITADWHRQHEDIATMLQWFKNPTCIDHVVKAMHMSLDYWYDDGDAFIRKCANVLGAIKTDDAIEKLKSLASSDNEIIKKHCLHQLEILDETD